MPPPKMLGEKRVTNLFLHFLTAGLVFRTSRRETAIFPRGHQLLCLSLHHCELIFDFLSIKQAETWTQTFFRVKKQESFHFPLIIKLPKLWYSHTFISENTACGLYALSNQFFFFFFL